MLFSNNYSSLLSEAAAADLLDASVSSEVKDTIKELEDDLTNNVEEVKPADQVNDDLALNTEMCIVREASTPFSNGARFMIEMSDLIRLCEEEEAQAAEAGEDTEADAGEKAEEVADANDVPSSADVVVVVNSEMASLYAEMAILEAKCGRKNGKGKKKLDQLKQAVEDVKNKGIKVVKTSKKKGKK